MSIITLDTVNATAKLSYIELNEDVKIMQDHLTSISQKIEQLQEVDTAEVNEFKHAHFTKQTMREDVANAENNRDKLAKLAPKFSNDAYQIPIVLANTGK